MKTFRISISFILGLLSLVAIPVHAEIPLDFDGDGKTDFGIIRYNLQAAHAPLEWYICRSSDNSLLYMQFGLSDSTFGVSVRS